MITSRATSYSSEIVDIFTTRPILNEAGVRAACKRLWLQWITAAGRQLHIEYALTHSSERLLGPERPYISVGDQHFRWGPIYLYKYDSANLYIAGMSANGRLDVATCSYSVLFRAVGNTNHTYVFTKYDRARQIRVEIQCGRPGATKHWCAATIINEYNYRHIIIITPSSQHMYIVGNDWIYHESGPGQSCIVLQRTVHEYRGALKPVIELPDPGPIHELIEFMMTPRLDIWEHLPPWIK